MSEASSNNFGKLSVNELAKSVASVDERSVETLSDAPIVSPYVFVAYDYDKYAGLYFEAGLKHDFVVEGTGLTITALANIAFVANNSFYSTTPGGKDTGLQHYEVGIVGQYSLNQLFRFSPRYGRFSLEGYLYYDDRTSTDLRANIQIWGGGGIAFHY